MRGIRRTLVMGAALGALVACSSTSGSGTTSSRGSGACAIPAAAQTAADGGASGCMTQQGVTTCEVPSGSTVLPDGAIITPDGAPPPTCSDSCSDGEYALTCTNNAPAADSLGCRIIPLPTPNGVTIYCCPCK